MQQDSESLSSPLLEFVNVAREFRVKRGFFADELRLQAVRDVSFSLHKGESIGLVGESGCGKSTLGRLAVGLLPASSGHIMWQGAPLSVAGQAGYVPGQLQMVFQDPFSSLNPRWRVGKAIAEPLRAQGVSAGESAARVASMLELVGLDPELGERYPHEFSGGQRQRMAVARALITHPQLVVCDEPVSALDASVQAQILNLFKEMQERFSPAYLFISHDLAVVSFLCQRIMVMYLGQVVEEATVGEMLHDAAHPYTRALLRAVPSLRAPQKLVEPLAGELPSPLAPPSGCPFHPRCPEVEEQCRLSMPEWTHCSSSHRVRCYKA